MSTIPAIYEQGVFRPTQPVDLPENCEVVLQVQVSGGQPAATSTPDKSAQTIETRLAALAAQVPAEQWEQLPPDLGDQLDHYIYGTPKQ